MMTIPSRSGVVDTYVRVHSMAAPPANRLPAAPAGDTPQADAADGPLACMHANHKHAAKAYELR
jgi:hypothetical protein